MVDRHAGRDPPGSPAGRTPDGSAARRRVGISQAASIPVRPAPTTRTVPPPAAGRSATQPGHVALEPGRLLERVDAEGMIGETDDGRSCDLAAERHPEIAEIGLVIAHPDAMEGVAVDKGDLGASAGVSSGRRRAAPMALHSPAKPPQ